MKRIVTMQDVSCIGKCSLTVALPIISSMGIETAILPTAVLSTHTAFKGFTFHDLTSELEPILEHWKNEKFEFDALYTGYLGSFKQIEIAKKLFQEFGSNSPKIVDPCMADNGKLYPGFTTEFAKEMKNLCSTADYICPNMTEASFLLNIPYKEHYTKEYIQDVLVQLSNLGSSHVVITGASFNDEEIGVYAYDKEKNKFTEYYTRKLPVSFHGTGDIWASTFTGALALGRRFEVALEIATDFTYECMDKTLLDPKHVTYGVNFEEAIPYLIARLNYRQ